MLLNTTRGNNIKQRNLQELKKNLDNATKIFQTLEEVGRERLRTPFLVLLTFLCGSIEVLREPSR
jgi:hypothetical protein